MTINPLLEFGLVAVGIVASVVIAYQRGIGVRTMQMMGLFVIGPIILALGFERALDTTSIAALLGIMIGFVLSLGASATAA